MYITKTEVKKELNINEMEYTALKESGYIIERNVRDPEGFVRYDVVDDRQVEYLKSLGKKPQ